MEVHAMAMVLAVLLTRGVAGEEEVERGSRQQRKRPCPWTLWCCKRAPRGWRLFQLVFPWLTILVLCMPCLGVAGHGMFTVDRRAVQYSLHFFADGLLVHDQDARPVTCHPVTSDHKDSVLESTGLFHKEKPSEDDGMELSRSSETGMLPDLLAEEELRLASCMLPGWSYVQQALLRTAPQAELSAEIIIQASSVEEEGVAASLDWGSNSLTSVSLKFLTLVNRQANKELKVLRMLTTNTQFCTVDFQEAVVSPGSKLYIPIAYFVNLVGKAEGRMLLQTNAGSYIVETLGEGIPFLNPLLGFMGASKSELWETVPFFNPTDESISVDEAYVWVESTNQFSTSYQEKGEGGVLCKRYDSEPESFSPSRLKVRPRAEWFLVSHSSSPIMDLSIMVDDGKHLVGTLCFKIFRHSLQLFHVLLVPLQMEWDSLGTSNEPLSKQNLVEVVAAFLETEKQARFLVTSTLVPVQVKNASAKGQSHNRLITTSIENLLLGVGVNCPVAEMSLIYFSGKSSLAYKFSCSADFSSVKKLFSSTNHLALRDLCSALLFYDASRVADVDEHRCSETLFKCTEDVFCHNCFDMPSAPCKVDALVDGLFNRKNVHGPKFIHAHDLNGRHMWQYHAADLAELAKLGNILGNDFNLLKKLTSEGFVVLSPCFANPKSVCAWPRIVLESNTYARILHSSASMLSRTSNYRFCMGSLGQHDYLCSRDMDSNILYRVQKRNLIESQKFGCIASYRTELVGFANGGSEYSRLFFCCKKLLKFMDFLDSNILEETVAEDCFEACCVPLKSILAVLSPPICHVSLSFSRHQKMVLKLSLLILFSVFVMLIKVLRREKQLASDLRLRHSCSHTFFFQSVCLKTGYIKASESPSNFEHSIERINSASSLECQNDQYYNNRFLVVMARVVGSLCSMFRSFFDLQATVLNVRVQISERPRAASVEQDPNYSKNSLIADKKNCKVELNNVKESGSHQTTTTMQGNQGISCRGSADTLRVTHLEAGTSSSVNGATTHSTAEDEPLIRSVGDFEKVQHKEKKEKGKRRKRRSNIIDLKQESERMGQSGSSSPPSSPASPATPLAHSPISPFLQSDSPARSLKGSAHSRGHSSNSFRNPTPRSTLIQFSSEMLSQLDVRVDHTCNSANKGRLQHLCTLGSKASLEPLPTRMAAVVTTEFCAKGLGRTDTGKGSVRTDTRKDSSACENWAAVARRALATPSEADHWQGLSSSSRCLKNAETRNKPVLLPSASFPQSGRSMQWNPRMLEERSFTLNDPSSSPSLISTSLVAPNARAPGSRPANHYNEKLQVTNLVEAAAGQLEVGSTVTSTDLRIHEGNKSDTFLYDIWGDHFAEISRSTQADIFSTDTIHEDSMMEITPPAFPKVGGFFAASDLMTSASSPGSADAAVGHSISIPAGGFSVFSCDTFFPPYHCKDAAGSATP